MSITNQELATKIQEVLLGHETFVGEVITWGLSTNATETFTDPYTAATQTVPTPYSLNDISLDQAKLDTIETGATADQTGAEIKTALFAEADTNNFSDALLSKLNAIESGATADQTGAQIKTALFSEADTNNFSDLFLNKLAGIESGATGDQTGAEIKTALFAEADTNNLTDSLLSKLNGIEAGATGDQSKADIDALGINAATLDGKSLSTSGDRRNVIPYVSIGGALEIGHVLDFHDDDASTIDNDARIWLQTGVLRSSVDFTVQGVMTGSRVIASSSSTNAMLHAVQAGTGIGFLLNHTGASGDVLDIQSDSSSTFKIIKNGDVTISNNLTMPGGNLNVNSGVVNISYGSGNSTPFTVHNSSGTNSFIMDISSPGGSHLFMNVAGKTTISDCEATKFGLNLTPVSRQSAIASPAASIASLQTAVDALITTLETFGLVTPN